MTKQSRNNVAVFGTQRTSKLVQQFLATLLSVLLVSQPVLVQAQQITPDTSAPVVNQPTVGTAPNTVPLVDIVAPNAQGLSHNKYNTFNVDTQGAILNNFPSQDLTNKEVGKSVLGGATPGNKNLINSGPASVILNEVTSTNRSALNGQIEIFGSKADLIIANPNGITCDGCGFINTPRMTLTTGKPDISSDGRLSGFNVEGGDITFGSKGANFAADNGKVDLFDVVSRSVHVNGKVYGKDFRLTAGRNKFNYATGEATALTAIAGTPEFAIDGSALGAMQADRIKIVVTEKGAGVRMRGDMAATTGELSLSADGKISIGDASSNQGVTIDSRDSITAGKITKTKRVVVRAEKGITLQSIADNDSVELAGGFGLVSITAEATRLGSLKIVSDGGISLDSAEIAGTASLTTSGNVKITGTATANELAIMAAAGSIAAASLVSFSNMTLIAGLDIGMTGDLLASGSLVATGRTISAGQIVSGLDSAATKADPNGKTVLFDKGDLQLVATSGAIKATSLLVAGTTSISAQNFLADSVTSHSSITVNGAMAITGQVLGATDISITGGEIRAGTIASGVDLAASGSGTIILGSTGRLVLASGAQSIDVGTLLSAGDFSATGSKLTAQNISGHGSITVAGDVDISGQMLGANNILINGHSIKAGILTSGVDFNATATSKSIALQGTGDLTLNMQGGTINAATMLAAGDLSANAASIRGANLTGHKNVVLNGTTNVSGQILGARDITVTGPSIAVGEIVSGVDFAATSASPDRAIALSSTGELRLDAGSGMLKAGSLLSAGGLTASAGAIDIQKLSGHGDVTLASGTAHLGRVLGAGNVAVTASQVDADSIVSGVDFDATARSSSGSVVLTAQGDLLVTAAGGISVQSLLSAGNLNINAGQGSITATDLISGGDLNAHAMQDIAYNRLQSFGSASLTADQGSISIDKSTQAGGNITLATKSVDLSNNRGIIATARTLFINAQAANLARSSLTFGGLGLALTGAADLTDTQLNAITAGGGAGDININASSLSLTAATNILAQHDLTLTLPGLTNPGQLAAGHDLTLRSPGNFTNTSSGLTYSGNDTKLLVAGDVLNDQGAILSGHDLAIAANENGGKNRSVTNISEQIRADNDVTILTEKLTNKRVQTPTWHNVVVASNVVSSFQLNPDVAGKPFAYLEDTEQDIFELYPGAGTPLFSEYQSQLWSQITLDGISYRAWTWNSANGPTSVGPIFDWIKSRVPKDANGNPVLDKKNPSKFFIVDRVVHGDGDASTTYTWDDKANISQTIREDQFEGPLSKEGLIRAGNDLIVDATTLNNSYSSIEAGGNATLKGTILNNEGVALSRATTTTCNAQGVCEAFDAKGNHDPSKDIAKGTAALTKVETVATAAGNIRAGGALDLSGIGAVNNTPTAGSIAGFAVLASPESSADPELDFDKLTAGGALFTLNSALTGLQAGSNPQAGAGPAATLNFAAIIDQLRLNGQSLADLAKPQSGGVGGTIPGQGFLYETRAAFLDVGKFYGSGYFVNRIGYSPDRHIPFLGDAYFENQLIDQQLRQLAGQGFGKGSFLPGSDAIEQMKALLDNGIEYAKANHLAIGEQLSPAKAAALTQSVVLYEKKTVQGVEVLVPVVYIANVDKANLTVAGALITGGSVNMNVGNLNNSGAIAAKNDLKIAATNVKANGGSFIAGGNVNLASTGDLTLIAQSLNIGGQNVVNPNVGLKAGGNATLAASNNLTLQGASVDVAGNAALSGKNITLDVVKVDNAGSQNATGAKVTTGGSLSIAANDNVNIIGSAAKAGASLDVTAENGSVNVVTTDLTRKTDDGYSKTVAITQQQSQLSSGTDTTITAGDDVLLSGSSVDAGGNVKLSAGDDINITAAQEQANSRFGKNSSSATTHTGSEIKAGGSIAATAGNGATEGDHDLNIIGSKLAAGEKVQLKASDDITIAEALDTSTLDLQQKKKSGGLFGGSRKWTTHVETETAIGSSITGGTGVDINSGGDTLISASKLQAGTADAKADLNVTTGGDLVVASGKDTYESDVNSSKKGFLTKSSGHTHIYDESTVGSELGASGNVTLNAGKDAVISGSQVTAGESIDIEGNSVSIIGAAENHAFDSQQKKSGLFAGSGDGFYSLWGKEEKEKASAAMLNAPSLLSAGKDVTINARKTDLNIVGSQVEAGQDIALSAAQDVNILPGAESMSQSEKEKRSGFGVQVTTGPGSASIGIGYGSSTDQSKQSSQTNAVSGLSAGRDLAINAGRDANLQAAQVAAERDVSIVAARDVNLLSAQDTSNYEEVHEKLFAGVTLSVSSGLVSAAGNVQNAAEKISSVSGSNSVSNAAIAGLNAYQSLLDVRQAAKDVAAGTIASGSLTAGFEYSKSEQNGSLSTPIPTTIRGGQSVTIEATDGTLFSHGAQIAAGYNEDGTQSGKAGDISLTAGKDVILQSAQEYADHSSKNTSAGANIGVGFNLSLKKGVTGTMVDGGFGWQGGAHFGQGKENGSSVTQLNTHVGGTGDVFIQSGNDTKLRGAVVTGKKVVADVGGDLIIESQLDTASQKTKQFDVNAQFSSGGAQWSAGGTLQKASGDAAMVGEQSGIHAGSGGFDITVKDKTSLAGGLITSAAPEALNRLQTGTLEVTDIDTHSDWKAKTYGGGIDSSGALSIAPPLKDGGHETGKALSAISPGQIVITDPANQKQKIEDIRRDTLDTNTSLPGIPDLQNVLAEQYKTQADYQAAAATLANVIGDISNKLAADALKRGDTQTAEIWDADGVGRAALHALGGGLLGGVNGVSGAIKGAIGGAISTLAASQIREIVASIVGGTKLAGTPQGEFLINSVTSSLVQGIAAAAGGGDAAAYAGHEFKYNYLTHKELEEANKERAELQKAIAECEIAINCSSEEVAILRDELQASRAYYQKLSDDNNAALVEVCAASFSSAACTTGRRDLQNAVEEEAGLQAHVLGTSLVNTPDSLLLGVLNNAANNQFTPDQIAAQYKQAITQDQAITEGTALALLAVAGAAIAPEVYVYCYANPIACMQAVETAGCIATMVCDNLAVAAQATRVSAQLEATAAEQLADDFLGNARQFWKQEPIQFKGNKVYQRDDLIDPMRIDQDGLTNLERMRRGLAPIGPDGKSIELHHMLQTQNGPIAEVTKTFHQKNGSTLEIDAGSEFRSNIDRNKFDYWRKQYWRDRAKNFSPPGGQQ